MYCSAFLFFAVLFQALPSLSAVHEKLGKVPAGWSKCASAPSNNTLIVLTIGLAQRNLDQLETRLLSVSTPGGTNYGQHLDKDHVKSLFAPSATANKNVQAWLKSAGVNSISSDGEWVTFQTTVEKANKLLDTNFLNYRNNGDMKLRTTQYSVPDGLAAFIDLITPTTYFGSVAAQLPAFPKVKREGSPAKRSIDSSCQTVITPKCIKQLYNIGTYAPIVSSGSKVGFSSFVNQSARYTDLALFQQTYNIPSQNLSKATINGGINYQNISEGRRGEANLDVQVIVGVSNPLPVIEYITGGLGPFIPSLDAPTAADNANEPWLPYFQYLLAQSNAALPQVITNSYGEEEEWVPRAYAIRVCNMIGMLGLRGISVLASSGDIGVGSSCKSTDGKNTTQFMPTFPASCPYVTSVGGTQGVTPELGWGYEFGGSSGGFSNYFSQAWYQTFAINDYLSNHISTKTKQYYRPFVNFAGRGFPDISAHSFSPAFDVAVNGEIEPSGGGTSASSPVVAGIIALLNDARFRAGKPALGFLNPLLYGIGTAGLKDIVGGGSIGCTGKSFFRNIPYVGGGVVPYASWNATIGWDPVTGLGTPDFQKLKALVLKS